MNPMPLVLATLRRHKAAFGLFVLLIGVAIALGIAISASERALRRGSARAADKFDLVVAAPGSRTDAVFAAIYLRPGTIPLLDAATTAKILSEPRARFAAPLAYGDSVHGAPVVGTIAAFVTHLSGPLAQGRVFASMEEAVVGAASPLAVGETFRPQHGDGHSSGEADDDDDEAHEHPVDIKIVGRMQPTGTPWDRAIIVPVEQVWHVHGLPDGHPQGEVPHIGPPFDPGYLSGVPAIIVQPKSINDAYGLRTLFKTPTSIAFFPAEVLVQLYSVMGDVQALLNIVSIAAEALVALAIFAALAALFALNRRQSAVLRALGAPPAFFALSAWIQVALIIIAGTGLGLLLGIGAADILANILTRQSGIALSASLGWPEVRLAGVFVLAGLVLALVPALMAARNVAQPEQAL